MHCQIKMQFYSVENEQLIKHCASIILIARVYGGIEDSDY